MWLQNADDVIVLKNGKIVEWMLKKVFQIPHTWPKHPYDYLVQIIKEKKINKNNDLSPILEINNITKNYDTVACDDVSFKLFSNEILGVVGESGSGKTTVSNLILRLTEPTSGNIFYHGKNIFDFDKKQLFNFRRKVQVVFQDPFASLNPTMNVYDIISEPWVIHSDFLDKKLFFERVSLLLISVGLAFRFKSISSSIFRWSKTKNSNC